MVWWTKSVASFCTVEFNEDVSISLRFFVLTLFFLANKGSLFKVAFLFFLSFILTNSHSYNEALIGSGSSSVGPFQPTKCNKQIYVSLVMLPILKPFLPHACIHFFVFSVSSFWLFFSHSVIPSLIFFYFGKPNKMCSFWHAFWITWIWFAKSPKNNVLWLPSSFLLCSLPYFFDKPSREPLREFLFFCFHG